MFCRHCDKRIPEIRMQLQPGSVTCTPECSAKYRAKDQRQRSRKRREKARAK